MTKVTDNEGRGIAFMINDYEYKSIATEDFSPTEDASLTASAIGKYADEGFLVCPRADGLIYGITWHNYHKNGDSLTGLTPQRYYGLADQWIPCRYIKIYASNDATYASVPTAIVVGFSV